MLLELGKYSIGTFKHSDIAFELSTKKYQQRNELISKH